MSEDVKITRRRQSVDDSNPAREVSPYELPGSQLRTKTRAAYRGLYAPSIAGAPSTTRQAAVLNTALIGQPTGTQGIANGRDQLSHTLVAHDPITAYNARPRLVSSPNTIVAGGVGGGKSSFVKTVCVGRPLLLKYRRAVVFDKKPQGDEGEYAAIARAYGAEPLRFTLDGSGSTRLNLLDPLIVRNAGTAGTYRLLHTIVRIARDNARLTEWEEEAIRAALTSTLDRYEGGRTPTMSDVLPFLGTVPDETLYRDLAPSARDMLHHAGLGVRWTLTGLLDEYAGLLDGETSDTVDLTGKLTSFDISQLPNDGPAVNVVRAIGNEWMMGRLRGSANRGWGTTVVYEEGWDMVDGPTAHLLKSNQKLSRALGLSNVFVFHKGKDIAPNSPGQTVISEAQSIYMFRQDRPEDAAWAVNTFDFEPSTAEVLQQLAPGHFIFKYGSQPEVHVQHVRSEWERELTDTDDAMQITAEDAGESR
ncbi:ATP/GTP-binding protein [uncultured Microbacterium sp.]|uniref:ATP/GTP-binding protein n=1 Tax=uncultured Microbacterium sp. TaxID=191216 RepID=UPI0025905BB2|nr:ATP/GTP-binding protein [uncultured Microbacterium sp.]